MAEVVRIGGRLVGKGQPVFIIAEAGVNHNGKLDLALRLVEAAYEAGADAVKFQTFRTGNLVAAEAKKAPYQERTSGPGSQSSMLTEMELDPDAFRKLARYAQELGLIFLSTPFDLESLDLLVQLGVPALKVASGELTNLPFLQDMSRRGLPLLLSTGMATLGEVEVALDAIRAAGDPDIVLLHCVSEYPAPAAHANLKAMHTLRQAFGLPVGFSDHTLGIHVAVASVALGAVCLEKHLTLDRTLPGPDHAASLEPGEFRALVAAVREVEAALGDARKRPVGEEWVNRDAARRSIVAIRHIPAGATIQRSDVAVLRPGSGVAPAFLDKVVGRVARQDIPAGTPIRWEMI